jgi:hypothetical protein
VPFCKTLFSSLAEAVKALAESNARRAELENELEEARAQLRSAKTKDFNAGRLFRLEIENSEFQRELDLYKGALEDARQQILLNAQQRQVALPLEIESLRHDLSAAESALKCAEASRDAAVQELERLRYSFDLFKVSTQTQHRQLLNDNASLRRFALLPRFTEASALGSSDAKSVGGVDFESIFRSKERNHSVLSSRSCSSQQHRDGTTQREIERQPLSSRNNEQCDKLPRDHQLQPPPTASAVESIQLGSAAHLQIDIEIDMRAAAAAAADAVVSPRTLLKDSSSFFPVHFTGQP